MNDWRTINLGEILRLLNNKSISQNQFPVLTSSRSGLLLQSDYFKKIVSSKNNTGYKIIKKGQFTYRSMSDDGFFKFNRLKNISKGIISPAYKVFEVDENNADSTFIEYLLNSRIISSQIYFSVQGGTRLALRFSSIEKFKVKLPSLYEQMKIAEILSCIDKTISSIKNKIQNLSLLKNSISNDSFNFLNNVPYISVEKLTSNITNGFVGKATPFYKLRGIKYLTSKNIRENKIDIKNMIYISEDFHKVNSRSILRLGDVLMVQSGHIGTTAVVSEEFQNSNCHALILMRFHKDKINPNFISYFFNSDIGRRKLSDVFVGSTIKHVNTKDIKKFKIPKPSLLIQNEICDKISSVENHINIFSSQLNKYLNLKRGISQDLLSGQKKVNL